MKIVQIPRIEIRRGCDLLLGQILRHAACAHVLLEGAQPEGAFLFFLIGFEELGKLIQLVDAGQAAEASQSEVAEVAEFFSHADKAKQSAKNVALAFNMFIGPLRDAGLDTTTMEEYVTHLLDVKENFERFREGMMYLDFGNGTWFLEKAPKWDWIYMDASVLYLACIPIWSGLQSAVDFRTFAYELNKSAKEFRNGFPKFIEDMRKEVAKLTAQDTDEEP